MRINRGLMRYEQAWEEYIRLVVNNLVEDGIYYAEIRFALHHGSTVISNDGERLLSHKEMLQIVSRVVTEEKEKLLLQGLTFYGIKVIYANLRSCSREQMKWCMDEAITLKMEFPELICGIWIRCLSVSFRLTFEQGLIYVAKKIPAFRSHTGSQN